MQNELKRYAERAKEIIDQAPQMGEANTKEMLIRRFIEVLGWDFLPSEVKLEYPVQMASRKTKVDYALMVEGTPVVFVEAKGLDTSLSETHRKQITSYLHNEEGVEWGLLTNGKEYELYKYNQTPSGQLLGRLRLEQLESRANLVRTLSKPSVKAGESEEIARKVQARRAAVSTLRSDKEEIAEKIAELVTDHIGEGSVSPTLETQAKEFVDQAADALEERGEKIGGAGTPDTGDTEPTAVEPEPPAGGPDGGDIVFSNRNSTVASFKASTQSDAMGKAVEYLIEEFDLLDDIPLPYVPGNKKAIINNQPTHPDGSEMRGFHAIPGDIYVDTHMNKRGKEKELSRLAGKCGLDVEFNW